MASVKERMAAFQQACSTEPIRTGGCKAPSRGGLVTKTSAVSPAPPAKVIDGNKSPSTLGGGSKGNVAPPASPTKYRSPLKVGPVSTLNVVSPGSPMRSLQKTEPSKLSSPFRNRVSDVPVFSPKSTAEMSRPPNKKIDIAKGSAVDTVSQGQSDQSEKAKKAVVTPKSTIEDQDWNFLYELALQYDQYKQQGVEESKNPTRSNSPDQKVHEQGDKKNIKSTLESIIGGSYNANGSFLTDDFITQYLAENKKFESLAFQFCGQKLFKRFDRKDDERENIIIKFVDALLNHPRSSEITEINMSNSLLPGAFLQELSDRCLEEPNQHLPKLRVINLESNLLDEEGVVALSKAIAHPQVWKRLQVLKLENQKLPFTAEAEQALAEAILESPSIVAVSLSLMGGLERQQINNTVAANLDNLRQARRKHKESQGILQERKRNEMEQFFDKIAQNDPSITAVDLVGNIKFLGLNPTERTKAGEAFASNSHVKTIKMVNLKLDDPFAAALGWALSQNTTIETIVLDSNDISGLGMRSLFQGLGQNSRVTEVQVRHQSKTTSSTDEKSLPSLLESNQTILKLGIDLRDQVVRLQLDRKTNENREFQRKRRTSSVSNN